MEKIIGEYKIEVIQDSDPRSPREDDNLGKMICFHHRYNLGDKHSYNEFSEFNDFLYKNRKKLIVLPVYLYDHSGQTVATTPFSCPWDSGKVGYIYVEKSKVREEYSWKNLTKKRVETIKGYLDSEVKIFDQYLQGDIYGYKIFKGEEELESCWGFYGEEYCLGEVESIVNYMIQRDLNDANKMIEMSLNSD